jgi:signal transduction histidine kinase/DNA-binding response OmpR family regulator
VGETQDLGGQSFLFGVNTALVTTLGEALSGGGEMGALIRANNWNATPLGAPELWPQSLRTALSMMLESRFAMVVAWGPDSRFFYNDRYRPVLGGKHPASLGMPGREIFPEVWGVVGPEFERVLRGEAFALDDWLLPLDRNGYLENCWFTVSYSPIRDETGGVGGVLAVVAETTGRVEGERRLAILRDLARSMDARTTAEACGRATAIFGANTMDVPFSLAYLVEPGGSGAQLVAASDLQPGSAAAPVEVDLTSTSHDTRWPIRAAIANREVRVVENAMELFGPLPGGPNPEPAHSALVLPLARAGTTTTYGALVLGVSPRRALDERYRSFMELATEHVVAGIATASAYEEERRRAEALSELNRAKTAFFSNVSHEFRTPLTLLLGPIADLLGAEQRSSADRQSLELIERNALRLLKLVNTLLDFSRIEAGRAQASFSPQDLCALTIDLASAFRSTIERAGLALRVECEPLPESLYVDREMWEKIVLNLISNAFKHTFDGEIDVAIRYDEDARQAVLTVRDTGVGIPAEEVPRIFERFHQVPTSRSRTHEGSGIGLSLVRELVRLHGGDVSVVSRVGEGSTFRVVLPLGHAHLPASQVSHQRSGGGTVDDAVIAPYVRESSRWEAVVEPGDGPNHDAAAAATESGALDGAIILVVDDNADMRDYVSRLLNSAGARVALATNGREALERMRDVQREAPDVVLSDVMMPELDGFGLLAAMRADERLRATPLIMLSARAGEEARVGGIAAGADDYLIKPFVAKELVARVAAQLRLARASRGERVARAEAEAARGQMSRVFEQAPIPICVIEGHDLRYTTANAHYRQLIGNRNPVGRSLLELWPELEGSEIVRVLHGILATGEAHAAKEFKVRFDQFGTGVVRDTYFNFVYHPLQDGGGRTFGIIAIAVDVTPQVIARQEAERLRESAEAANEAKLHLLRTVSHETRQPVHASLGYVDLLMLGVHGDLTDEQRSDLEKIRRNQSHMLGLLNDILSFAKLEAGALELEVEKVEATTIIEAVDPLVRAQFEAKGVEYIVSASARPAAFQGDRERTIQICVNLLTNALKATKPGGQVTISCESHADRIDFAVRDTGIGIPESKLAEIFNPFTSLARVRAGPDASGVGLGLSISRQLARAMSGDVTVTSTVGVGSTFTLSLPCAPVLSRTAAERSATSDAPSLDVPAPH